MYLIAENNFKRLFQGHINFLKQNDSLLNIYLYNST